MNIASLRIQGSDSEVIALRTALSIPIDVEWKQGEHKSNNTKHEKSGFNACIADVEYTIDLKKRIHEFLSECKLHGISFKTSGIEAEIDIGIGVGLNEQFAPSICMSIEDMQLIVELGLEFRVSAYPCSDDE